MTKQMILQELYMLKNYETPIIELEQEENQIFIKKEDIIPFSFGGNKVRIAANYFIELIEKECNVVVTYGASSSNLCRVIANMAARYKVKCVIVSPEENYEDNPNSRLVQFLGAEIIKCPIDKVSKTIDEVMDNYRKSFNPFFIYGGGHGAVGTDSYRNVLRQIIDYENQHDLKFDMIFITLATGTSMSGLIVENELSNSNKKIIGISVARDKERATKIMDDLLVEYNQKLSGVLQKNLYVINDEFRCGGYGKYDESILSTIREVFEKHGTNLDSTYTGKGYYGMKSYLKREGVHGKKILFIHTGGTPLFFKNNCSFLEG